MRDIGLGEMVRTVKEDCNLTSAFGYFVFFMWPIINGIIIMVYHRQVIDFLQVVCQAFEDDFFYGLGLITLMYVCYVPANGPHTFISLFGTYCFVKKFGNIGGFFLGSLMEPAIFCVAAILPYFMTKALCKNTIKQVLIEKMRILRALEASFEKHGLKLVILVRLAPVSPMNSQNYFLATTRCKFPTYMLGSYLGALPMSLCYCYVATGIKSVVEVVDGEHKFTWVDGVVGVLAGILIIGLSCSVMQDAKRQLISILENEELQNQVDNGNYGVRIESYDTMELRQMSEIDEESDNLPTGYSTASENRLKSPI